MTPADHEAPYSNIDRRDYVGPEVCGSCHKDKYEAWRDHPHAAMNADATPGSVVGDFSKRRLAYGDGEVEFDRRDGHYTMALLRQGKLVRRFRVTRTVGSRLIQMYMGVQTEGPEPATDAVAYSAETKLPFAWWVRRKEWFPETYDELPPTPEYDDEGRLTQAYRFVDRRGEGSHNWKANFIRCHNTYPYALRLRPGRRAGRPWRACRQSPRARMGRPGGGRRPPPRVLRRLRAQRRPRQRRAAQVSRSS